MSQGEEMAVTFGFDEQGEIRIEAFAEPKNGERFGSEEIKTTYLLASMECDEMKNDEVAVQLLNEYASYPGRNNAQAPQKPYEVYCMDEKFPSHLETGTLGNTSERSGRNKRFQEENTTKQSFASSAPESVQEELAGIGDNEDRGIPVLQSFAGKKYKPVALKTRPVYGELPERFRIKREIKGDPLQDLPELSQNPPDFVPKGRYTQERMEDIEKIHSEDFLWPEERKLMHHFMSLQEGAFAWDDNERGTWRHDFFPPVEIPTVEHKVWVERSIPIPRGQLSEFCKVIKKKIDAGVYEPSNSSYRSKFFGVLKKDGKSIRLVHALEPLNQLPSRTQAYHLPRMS